jgi:hypothetical protein
LELFVKQSARTPPGSRTFNARLPNGSTSESKDRQLGSAPADGTSAADA